MYGVQKNNSKNCYLLKLKRQLSAYLFTTLQLYFQLFRKADTHVVLTHLEVWKKKDEIDLTTNGGENLNKFGEYNAEVLVKQKKWSHDNAHLLT